MSTFSGIFIPTHKTLDADSKAYATQNLTDWQVEENTPEDWVAKLELGQTISLSAFSPQPDGTYTHKFKYWNSTHFVCADADNIKGVETLSDGSEKNPNGVDLWIDEKGLSKRYKTLDSKVYAVGQSVSSMSADKEPEHRRYRLIFLFDKPIESKEHYHQILLSLSNEFPIIPNDKRTPSQPVFGNAREGFPFHIRGNVLSLDDYPYTPEPEPVSTTHSAQTALDVNITLESYLQSHRVAYTPADESGKYFVTCPNKDQHTGGKHGKTDAYVFDDGKAWAFYCSHASCASQRTWEAFKSGNGIANAYKPLPRAEPRQRTKPQSKVISEPAQRINELADRLVKQPTQPEKTIEFPMDAIKGTVFEAYAKAFEGRSEVCPSYHFASLVNVFSGIAGGKILYSHDGEFTVKTNFYQCLLGIPSWSRKSSALDNSIALIESVLSDAPIIDALNTREGFIDGLDEDYPQAIIVLDEMNSLLTKSKTRAGAGLIDMLNTAFNSKTLSNNSITNRVSVDDPTVSFFGAITPDLLELSLDNEGLGGGFMSRCVFYEWEKQPRIRAWGGYDKGIMEIVKSIVESAASMTGQIIYTWSEKALERSTEWYNNFAIHDVDEDANAVGRVPYYADKLAALMSFSENAESDFKISLQTWKRVESIAEYWAEIYRRRITPSAFMTADLKTEQRIRSFLSKHPNGASKTDFNKLRSVSTRDRNQILMAMVQSGEVHFDDTNRIFQLITGGE